MSALTYGLSAGKLLATRSALFYFPHKNTSEIVAMKLIHLVKLNILDQTAAACCSRTPTAFDRVKSHPVPVSSNCASAR